jgi:hypothetical protein
MLESLFGAETPLAVRFFIAFIVVFALIGLVAWLVRRFGSGALGSAGARGRAPRLAVIEAGAVDGRRKLVLIRRDNVEHLLMIGGPADIVVEQNIVRGQSPAREIAAPRGTGAVESLPRALPLGEETTWPLQPEVAPRSAPRAAARHTPASEEAAMQWPAPPEPQMPAAPAPRRVRTETLAGLAAELTPRPMAHPEPEVVIPHPAAKTEPRVEHKIEPRTEFRAERKVELKISEPKISEPKIPEPKILEPKIQEPKFQEPKFQEPKLDLRAAPRHAPAAPIAPAAPAGEDHAASDANLSDMAQRLEAALRRPGAPLAPAAPVSPASPTAPAPVLQPAAHEPPAAKPAPAKPVAAKPLSPKPNDVFGSLEEEMASLLGRPSGKT